MKYRVNSLTALGSIAIASFVLPACTGSVDGNKNPAMTSGGGSASSTGGAPSSTGGTGTVGMIPGGNGPIACEGSTVSEAKRIVRLSFNQISNTMHSLLGDAFGSKLDADFEIGVDAQTGRTFPPLASPREGGVISATIWPLNDQMASAAGTYVLGNLDAVTACGAAPTDACAQTYIKTLAEKAYRRPLTDAETTSVNQVYTEVKTIYGTVPEAIQHSVYAIAQAPQLLYRTEFGTNQAEAGVLTPYELASELSYFLTDGPPDQPLLDAAKANKLATKDDISPQVARLLATPAAKKNLEGAMFSYFKLDNLATVKIDDPAFTNGTMAKPYTGIRESAYHEAELFFTNTLWGGPLTGLLTAKKSSINSTLAAFYGITLPSPPADETSFVQVDLPANRAGLMTQAGFLASNSRPDVPSVVARGLVINAALLCATNPPFPTDAATLAGVADAKAKLATETSRKQSEFRTTTAPCLGCHLNFDAYGLALDTYDAIGRYRTMDPQGRPIDPSVTLPSTAGGGVAKDTIDMETQVANAPGFASCVAKNMLNWALAEGSALTPGSCPATAVAVGFSGSDKSFSALLREIAVSEAFTTRNAGAVQ
ncbi:MAG: DUF1592 domain-containing protein [Myxococcales bacterium]